MKLNVPFYRQTTKLNCGPAALRMIFSYFGKELDTNLIEEKIGLKKEKGVSTIQLAIAAEELGFKTKFFSKSLYFDKKNLELDFYRKYIDMNSEKSKNLINIAKSKNMEIYEKTLYLKEILSYVTKDSIPLVLLDWNIVIKKPKKGYQGHFVPIIGYDNNFIYVHNHGLNSPKAFLPIEKNLFEKARKAKGTDDDILIVYKR